MYRFPVHAGRRVMLRLPSAPSPRVFGRWCAYALVLVLPGSLLVLPVLWIVGQSSPAGGGKRKIARTGHAHGEERKGKSTMNDREPPSNALPKGKPHGFRDRLRLWWRSRDAHVQYLSAATDLADLERRQRVLERACGGPVFVTFNH